MVPFFNLSTAPCWALRVSSMAYLVLYGGPDLEVGHHLVSFKLPLLRQVFVGHGAIGESSSSHEALLHDPKLSRVLAVMQARMIYPPPFDSSSRHL